jgi:hypothetical protein
MQKTAAGEITVVDSAFSPIRGGTKMFLGILADGRFVVTSKFQIELRTANQAKAMARFQELCRA